MADIDRDSRVLSLCGRTGLRQSLVTLLDQLGRCQKALNEFLEVTKMQTLSARRAFTRVVTYRPAERADKHTEFEQADRVL